MSSSEKDYLLRTPPQPGKKVILKGVAIGALVIGMLLALALSIISLSINQQSTAQGVHAYNERTISSEPFIEVLSKPISAEVCNTLKLCATYSTFNNVLYMIYMNRCSRHLASMSSAVICLKFPTKCSLLWKETAHKAL